MAHEVAPVEAKRHGRPACAIAAESGTPAKARAGEQVARRDDHHLPPLALMGSRPTIFHARRNSSSIQCVPQKRITDWPSTVVGPSAWVGAADGALGRMA